MKSLARTNLQKREVYHTHGLLVEYCRDRNPIAKDCTISSMPVCVNTLPGHPSGTAFVSYLSLSLAILPPLVTSTLPSKDGDLARVMSWTAMRLVHAVM